MMGSYCSPHTDRRPATGRRHPTLSLAGNELSSFSCERSMQDQVHRFTQIRTWISESVKICANCGYPSLGTSGRGALDARGWLKRSELDCRAA